MTPCAPTPWSWAAAMLEVVAAFAFGLTALRKLGRGAHGPAAAAA